MAGVLKKRRDAARVIRDILSIGARGASKTQMIYKVNLSYRMAQRYLAFLIDRGWLRSEKVEGRARFVTTREGEQALQELVKIERELSKLLSNSQATTTSVRN